MLYYQSDVILHLADNNLHPNGEPIIKVGDLIFFSEQDKQSKYHMDYDTFFRLVDMYFEYIEAGTRKNRTIRITGLLKKFQS